MLYGASRALGNNAKKKYFLCTGHNIVGEGLAPPAANQIWLPCSRGWPGFGYGTLLNRQI